MFAATCLALAGAVLSVFLGHWLLTERVAYYPEGAEPAGTDVIACTSAMMAFALGFCLVGLYFLRREVQKCRDRGFR